MGLSNICSEFTFLKVKQILSLNWIRPILMIFQLTWVVESDIFQSGLWERVLLVFEYEFEPKSRCRWRLWDYAFITDNGDYETVDFDVEDQSWGGSLNSELTATIINVYDKFNQSCESTSYNLFGSIALIKRGSCEFGLKALNAQNAGAEAVVIYNNNNSGQPLGMSAGNYGNNVTIPVFSMSGASGMN